MKTNQFFSPDRFLLLLSKNLRINYRKYLFTIVGAIVVGTVIIYMNMPRVHFAGNLFQFGHSKYTMLFMMFLIGLGAIIGSAFPELSNKTHTSNYLLIPASVFEKYLSQFVIRVLAGTALFMGIFWLDAHLARTLAISQMTDYYTQMHYAGGANIIEPFSFKMLTINSVKDNRIVFTSWIVFSEIVLTISAVGISLFSIKLFFQKMALVKTILSISVLFTLGILIMVGLSHLFYPETKGFDNHLLTYSIENQLSNIEVWIFASSILTLLFLLPLGYFKLKEKQV